MTERRGRAPASTSTGGGLVQSDDCLSRDCGSAGRLPQSRPSMEEGSARRLLKGWDTPPSVKPWDTAPCLGASDGGRMRLPYKLDRTKGEVQRAPVSHSCCFDSCGGDVLRRCFDDGVL